MARLHDEIQVNSPSGMLSLGSLIGSYVSNEVFDTTNYNGHRLFDGGDFQHLRQEFFDRHIRPMDRLSNELSKTVNALINPNQIRMLTSIEDFRSIPLVMELPILLFDPVRQAVMEGRMDGFGYDPSTLPEDVYGRLIDNFSCHDVEAASDEDGFYDISGTMFSDDPDLSDDQLFVINKTREYIRDVILMQTDRDPTDIDMPRG